MKNNSLFIFVSTLKNSFIELLLFVILFSVFIIARQLFDFLSIHNIYVDMLDYLIVTLKIFFPLLLLIIISINYSKVLNENISLAIISSMLIYVFLELTTNEFVFTFNDKVSIYTLIIPYISINLIHRIKNITFFNKYDSIDYALSEIFSYIIPLFSSIIITVFFLTMMEELLAPFIISFTMFFAGVPDLIFMPLYLLFGHLFWFLGVHGNNMAEIFFDASVLNKELMPNLTNTNFRDLFTVYGGAGSGLALVIAILINGKDEYWNKISKASLPFVVFNINEILIYGLPIVFNKYLFLPFICVPVMNFFIAYFFLSLGLIDFVVQDIHWAMPTFLNVYMATDGNILAILLQIILLLLSVLIYLPFVNMYVNKQNKAIRTSNFATYLNVTSELLVNKIKNKKENKKIIDKNIKVNNIIDLIHKNELVVYYQPKVDIQENKCNSFEALLRMQLENDELLPPSFLDELAKDGLSPIVDLWVCKEVRKQFTIWDEINFHPTIGINIHPATLNETDIVHKIVSMFDHCNVEFEILEKSFVNNKIAKENIKYIKESGFILCIDDFGTGYTNLETLYDPSYSIVKFDKSLIDVITNAKGFAICSQMSKLCHDLNLEIVAEGVETKEQVDIIKKTDIKYIQGYYYSSALAATNVKEFVKNFYKNSSE
jgi:lactose/cellobiose-specific phosphotransferase system IIC component